MKRDRSGKHRRRQDLLMEPELRGAIEACLAAAAAARAAAAEARRAAELCGTAERVRAAAEGHRRTRDRVFFDAEHLRQRAEGERAAAERTRRVAADQFDSTTRRAIREEVEIASEMQETTARRRRDRRPSK
jgi:hypothetical protein